MDENDGLIREVNDAMRQEKMQHFFADFGRYIVLASAAIILCTLGYVGWQTRITSQHEAATLAFYRAIKQVEEGKSFAAREAFEATSVGDDTSIAMLAKLWLVKLKHQGGKPEEASSMAQKILKDTTRFSAWAPYRDWLTLYLPANADAKEGATYRLTHMERLACAKIREGDTAEGARLYRAIAEDSATPQTMRERAELILHSYLKDKDVAVKKPKSAEKS
jgi:hypothetical protein